MKLVLVIVAAMMLLPVTAFCVFGFMATFEPTDQPGLFMAFRIGYGVVGIGCLASVVGLIWWAFHSPRITAMDAYSHTQKAPLCLILYGSALLCFVLAWNVGDIPGLFIGGGVGLLIALLAPAFHHLTVADQGERLAIRFGPVPLFRRTVQYADIDKVEVGPFSQVIPFAIAICE